jgi:hypothetical protein
MINAPHLHVVKNLGETPVSIVRVFWENKAKRDVIPNQFFK